MTSPSRFADLLRKGIDAIQSKESLDKKKRREDIYQELGEAVHRKASTIDYYLREHTPVAVKEVEQLAKMIFKRGDMDRKWLEEFLAAGGHPNPLTVCNELLTPEALQPNSQHNYPFRWLTLHHHIRHFSDRSRVITTHTKLQSLSDMGLESVRHRNVAELPNEHENLVLGFMPGERDDYGRMEHKITKQNSELLIWMVLFNPLLQTGQIASYSYTQSHSCVKNWTFEEVEELFNAGVITKKFAYMRYSILFPTDTFMITVEFPPDYPISFPSSGGVGAYRAIVEDLTEKTRLVADNSFSANFDRVRKQWTLQLKVNQAQVGVSYELQWIPPRKNKIAG